MSGFPWNKNLLAVCKKKFPWKIGERWRRAHQVADFLFQFFVKINCFSNRFPTLLSRGSLSFLVVRNNRTFCWISFELQTWLGPEKPHHRSQWRTGHSEWTRQMEMPPWCPKWKLISQSTMLSRTNQRMGEEFYTVNWTQRRILQVKTEQVDALEKTTIEPSKFCTTTWKYGNV